MSNEPFQPYPEESARADRQAASIATEQPPSIRQAVLLMRIGAAVSLLGLVLFLATLSSVKDQLRDQLAKSDTNFTSSELDTAYNAAIIFALIFGLIGVALWLWMASANGKGRKWARIVATILGVLNVLSFVDSVSTGSSPTLSLVLSLVSVVIGVAALFYVYRPDATAYYNASSRR